MFPHLKTNLGFTIVEIAASLLIIGIVVVPILRLTQLINTAQHLSERDFAAAQLIQAKMEEITSKPFAVDLSESGAVYPEFSGYAFDVVEENPYAKTSGAGLALKKVTVTVSWNTVLGSRNETVSTLIAE